MITPAIEARGLTKSYTKSSGWLRGQSLAHALQGISFEVAEGEVLGLVGESGCGKSTLARLILGIEPPSGGEVRVKGRSIASYDRLQRAKLIQPVFQDPYSSLNPRASVRQIVSAPLEVQGRVSSIQRRALVREMLDRVGLASYLIDAYPGQLSGGQRQRVAIARALISEPTILICDEPTSALDVSVQAQILNLLATLRNELGITLLLISHNLAVVHHIADRVAVMNEGRIVEIGPTEQLFENPTQPYTAKLLASILLPTAATRPVAQPNLLF